MLETSRRTCQAKSACCAQSTAAGPALADSQAVCRIPNRLSLTLRRGARARATASGRLAATLEPPLPRFKLRVGGVPAGPLDAACSCGAGSLTGTGRGTRARAA
eukprot:2920676-Rhodomonas_salina.1